ncbi:MAG: 4'-phosphopantetheinyl transferase superfamily protein [Desulfovibrio sp.]|jgi:4'-phosphopantetheinyl transferase|nr:4'-phosphopantetheinyl transferase superfamily protein [Desulfovibrio sp.]
MPRIVLFAAAYEEFVKNSAGKAPMPRLSEEEWRHINKFRLPEQRDARYAGHCLLHAALGLLGYGDAVTWGAYGQPAIPDSDVSASLSYCPGIVVAAAGESCRIGVDVEPESGLNLNDIRRALSLSEIDRVRRQRLPASLVSCWTAKEAVLKADGRGFAAAGALRDDLFSPAPVLDGQRWQLARYRLYFPAISQNCLLALAHDALMPTADSPRQNLPRVTPKFTRLLKNTIKLTYYL